ncbi:MAG: sigma-70 family RNA polymerase sigma factor [Firmicutes bacterium]|nr:sigma-70 family RNA polymerase sigma factor [Bacillota bacterium]
MNEELSKLIIDNENLIYRITHFFNNYSNKEDLFQVGCIGLIKAYNNYRDDYNTKFTTYAYPYILGEIKKYIREDKGIKVSRDITKLNLKIERAYLVLSQKIMREPSIKEVSEYLGIDEYYISEALCANNALQSLDEPIINNGKELTLYDTVSKVESMDIDTLIALKRELSLLNSKDYQIISEHYLQDKTQSEIAESLGINQVQVSRREQKILKKLKDKLVA